MSNTRMTVSERFARAKKERPSQSYFRLTMAEAEELFTSRGLEGRPMSLSGSEAGLIDLIRRVKLRTSDADGTLKDYAAYVAATMVNASLSRFAMLLDGDAESNFLEGINEANQERNPGDYADKYTSHGPAPIARPRHTGEPDCLACVKEGEGAERCYSEAGDEEV